MNLRSAARTLAYHSGALNALHRVGNRDVLTVVMFHRILPEEECLRLGADPLYTITPEFLAECRSFFEHHYNIVSLDDVLSSCRRVRPLPPWPLLITFDDGWRDNLDWALPVLRDCPWVIFAATDAVEEGGIWWQEALLWALRSGICTQEQLLRRAACSESSRHPELPSELHLLLAYAGLSGQGRKVALAPYAQRLRSCYRGQSMVSAEDLGLLHRSNVAIGAHGATHLPLTHLGDTERDLRRARNWLNDVLAPQSIAAMSFPHGRWNSEILGIAQQLGYEIMFTSNSVLNPCPAGWLEHCVLGRIAITRETAGKRNGNLAPPRMATWLYSRDSAILGAEQNA